MKISVEISSIAVFFLPDRIGECAHKSKTSFFKEKQAFFVADTFLVQHFPGDGGQVCGDIRRTAAPGR